MTLVVDASALAEFLVGSPRGVAVASALARDPQRHLPHLAIVETMSVMRRWARTGQVTEPRARAALTDLADFPACWRGLDATVEVEAKAKEVAVLKLKADLDAMGR